MEYRVAELANASGVAVDTVRFYQARGLISPPERRGRFAIYSETHLDRIRKIRSLLDSGFSLAQIRQLLVDDLDLADSRSSAGQRESADDGLLAALAEERVGAGMVSRSEMAAETGVPEALIAAAVQAGLIAPIEIRGEERFARSDLEMVVSGLEILGMGMPLDRLLELATQHASNVDQLVEQAIDLFDDYVRKPRREDQEGVRRIFEQLLPQATQIVALHFQRVVVARALARLRGSADSAALEIALEATQSARLEVQWR